MRSCISPRHSQRSLVILTISVLAPLGLELDADVLATEMPPKISSFLGYQYADIIISVPRMIVLATETCASTRLCENMYTNPGRKPT